MVGLVVRRWWSMRLHSHLLLLHRELRRIAVNFQQKKLLLFLILERIVQGKLTNATIAVDAFGSSAVAATNAVDEAHGWWAELAVAPHSLDSVAA